MKHFRFASVALGLALGGFAASAADMPKAPPTVAVQLSMYDVNILEAALQVAAQSCNTNLVGCRIGEVKDGEMAKLNAAAQELQTKK